MILQSIFTEIKNSFGGLWQTKERGQSLEIITPYATTNSKFISVFLSMQGNDFVISDGGWINSGIYENTPQNDEGCFLKVFYHYLHSFDIKEIETPEGVTYYYIKASAAIDVPAKVLALSSFVQSVVSVSEISFEDKAEKETKARFVSKANEYLKSIVSADKCNSEMNDFFNELNKTQAFKGCFKATNEQPPIDAEGWEHLGVSFNDVDHKVHAYESKIYKGVNLVRDDYERYFSFRIADYATNIEIIFHDFFYYKDKANLKLDTDSITTICFKIANYICSMLCDKIEK